MRVTGLRAGRPRLPAPARVAAIALCLIVCAACLAETASAKTITLGLAGWRVQSSAQAPQSGGEISQPGFPAASWLAVRPDDAGGVGTELGALVQNGGCGDVFFAEHLKQCFGYMSTVGPDTIPQFSVPWWFRTDFSSHLQPGQSAQVIVNGVVGQADLWVNGSEVSTQATVQGAFARYAFDVTNLVHTGMNSLALEVYPNDPTKMFTLDFVDWNQIPPDNNTGIQFPVQLHVSHALAISDAHVLQSNAPDLSSSALTLKADVTNNTAAPQTATVNATVTPPEGAGTSVHVKRTVTLAAGATRTIKFTPAEYPALNLQHPSVWWPYQMGAQPLYGLKMAVMQSGVPSDAQGETFGIRTVTSDLVGPSPIAPAGARRFLVNGKPLLFRGGGWAEDLMLRYSSSNTSQQIALMKNLDLNAIRTEGHQMPDDFYEQMDRAGILVYAGYQCCDAWQLPEKGGGVSPHEFEVLGLTARSIGEQLRDHPSVLAFGWSDNQPTPRQEQVSLRGFAQADFQDPLIASAEYKETAKLGPSGMKEGPYDWVPPSYWYDSSHFDEGDSSRTNVGGAWAFDSESSSGATVPTADSIQRFMSAEEQAKLWQSPDYNQYHLNYEPELPGPQNEGYSFGTLHSLDRAISNRYGAWSGLGQYVHEAQVQNYETQRAQFEAYIDHSNAKPTPSTGLVYWQLNKGWPSMLWNLYNWEFDQAGSYFGAKKANEPVHALYAYDQRTVSLDNLTSGAQSALSVESKVYGVRGKLLDDQTASVTSLAAQDVASGVITPKVPPATEPPARASTYFVELLVSQNGVLVDRNVYWLSTQHDTVDWPATIGKPQATMTRYADLGQLQGLAPAELSVSAATSSQTGAGGTDRLTTVTVTNTSKAPTVGFFLRADVRRGSGASPAAGDNQVLPILWSDNDVTLWPGESQTLTAAYRSADLNGQSPVVSVSGWNAPTVDVAAP
jgi:exo-1,4-beta-D-glucosaminidase